METQVCAVKAALVTGGYIQDPDVAEERARNIIMALDGAELEEPGHAEGIVESCLWVRHTEVRHLNGAAKACVRAWCLAQEPDVAARLSLLAYVGVPTDRALEFLRLIGLATT